MQLFGERTMQLNTPKGNKTVLVIPDTQLPFCHEDSIKFLAAVKRKFNPTNIVHVGDFFDLHALSNYDIDPDGLSAGDELKLAQKQAKQFYKLFPKCQLVTSNHDVRIYKKAQKVGIPKGYLVDYRDWMQFPKGWSIQPTVEIDEVLYFHGEGYSGAQGHRNACIKNMQSSVIGHIHSHAGIAYVANQRALCFGMNVGCLIDVEAYAFAYGKNLPYKPIICCGIVRNGVPQLVPMVLNGEGRWNKKL